MSEPDELQEILKTDPFGELTRKERTMLLLISTISIAISLAGLVPTKIVGFGIEFANIDRSAILWLLASAVFYFLITFLSHAWPEFTLWQVRYTKYLWVAANAEEPTYEEMEDYPYSRNATEDFKKIWHRFDREQANFKRATLVKIALDLLVPIGVGAAAMGIVIKATCFWC